MLTSFKTTRFPDWPDRRNVTSIHLIYLRIEVQSGGLPDSPRLEPIGHTPTEQAVMGLGSKD